MSQIPSKTEVLKSSIEANERRLKEEQETVEALRLDRPTSVSNIDGRIVVYYGSIPKTTCLDRDRMASLVQRSVWQIQDFILKLKIQLWQELAKPKPENQTILH
jgi:hypothetical protein